MPPGQCGAWHGVTFPGLTRSPSPNQILGHRHVAWARKPSNSSRWRGGRLRLDGAEGRHFH